MLFTLLALDLLRVEMEPRKNENLSDVKFSQYPIIKNLYHLNNATRSNFTESMLHDIHD